MILFIHNFYTQKGGEDNVFASEVDLMNTREAVSKLVFYNKGGIKGAIQFFGSVWNLFAAQKLKKHIQQVKPTVIHIHNLHFAIGYLAIRVAKKAGIPVIMTLHNYRLICPSGTLQHDGKIFKDSVNKKFPWKAVKLGVYRESTLQTFWLAFIIWFHKKVGTWNLVDRYIMLTEFAKRQFIDSSFGVEESKFVVKSNFVYPVVMSGVQRKKHFLFVGRLTEEKGVKVLLEAFKKSNFALHIAGNGPLLDEVKDYCEKNSNIHYLGGLDSSVIREVMQECTALIFPSIWYEGMPMTILEALSVGTPVIASKLGAMEYIVDDGYNGMHFEAGNVESLINSIKRWDDLSEVNKQLIRSNCIEDYTSNYSVEKNLTKLKEIYDSVRSKSLSGNYVVQGVDS